MSSHQPWKRLKEIFREDDYRQLFIALKRNLLIWEALIDESLLSRAIAELGEDYSNWSPAHIAELAMSEGDNLDARKSFSNESTRRNALDTYRVMISTPEVLANLKEAGLLALALKIRHEDGDNWLVLLREIFPVISEQSGDLLKTWKLPFAILYGWISDEEKLIFLHGLLPRRGNSQLFGLINHIILSQPDSEETQIKSYLGLANQASLSQQLGILTYLNLQGHNRIAQQLANELVCARNIVALQPEKVVLDELDVETLILRSLEYQRLAVLCKIAGETNLAKKLLDCSEAMYGHNTNGLMLQKSDITGEEEVSEGNGKPLTESTFYEYFLTSKGNFAGDPVVVGTAPNNRENPYFNLARAGWEQSKGNLGIAQDLVRKSVRMISADPDKYLRQMLPRFVTAFDFSRFIEFFEKIGMENQTIELADAILTINPQDEGLLELAGEVAFNMGNFDKAGDYFENLITLYPEDSDKRRKLARVFEASERWDEALSAWNEVVSLTEKPAKEDWFRLADCAVKSGDYQQAILACDELLALEPDHALGNAYKGDVFSRLGKRDEALGLLCRSVELAPEEEQTWLLLVKYYRENNHNEKAIETLRAASLACSYSLKILFTLGSLYLTEGMPTEALPLLRQAYGRNPESVEIASALAQALEQLGRLQEVDALYETMIEKWGLKTELVECYAKNLILLKRKQEALKVLYQVITAQPENEIVAELYLDSVFSEEFIDHQSRIDLSQINLLESCAEILPNDKKLKRKIYEADLLRLKRESKSALAVYQALLEESEVTALGWMWRIKAGMGDVQGDLGNHADAIRSLQEALAEKPESIVLLQKVAIAFSKNLMLEEALTAANEALQMASEDPKNLLWFASFLANIGKRDEALSALMKTIDLTKDEPDTWVEIAEIYLQAGDSEAVRQILDKYKKVSDISDSILIKIARCYVGLGDFSLAVDHLGRVVDKKPELIFSQGFLYHQLDNNERSREIIDAFLSEKPLCAAGYSLLADVLTAMERFEEALPHLEHTLRLLNADEPSNQKDFLRLVYEAGLIDPNDLARLEKPEVLHEKMSGLLVHKKDYAGALRQIKLALDYCPDRLDFRCKAIDLALTNLDDDLAVNLADEPFGMTFDKDDTGDVIQLICTLAEMALEKEEWEKARYWIDRGISLYPGMDHIQALQAKLFAQEGDYDKAQKVLDKIGGKEIKSLWYADALLDCQKWELAISLYQKLFDESPENLRVQIHYFKAYLACVEKIRMYKELGCEEHSPCSKLLDNENSQNILDGIRKLQIIFGAEKIDWLGEKADLLLNPSPETFAAFAIHAASSHDIALLAAAARWLSLPEDSYALARNFVEKPEVCVQLALSYSTVKPDLGLELAQQVVTVRKGDPYSWAVLARLCEVNEMFPEALAALEKGLNLWKTEINWHIWAANLSETMGQLRSVKLHLKNVLEFSPKNIEVKMRLGEISLKMGETKEALILFDEITHTDPNNEYAWINSAIGYQCLGMYKDSLLCAVNATKVNSNSPKAFLLCGQTSMALGLYDDAIKYGRKALELQGDDEEAVIFLARAQIARKLPEDAMATLEKALAYNPRSSIVLEKATLLVQYRGVKNAIEYLKKVNEDTPGEFNILKRIAFLSSDAGNYAEAEGFAQEALRINPIAPDINVLLGKLQISTGQLDKSIRYLGEAIRQDPGLIEAYLELANAHHLRREHYESLRIYQQAIQIKPDDPRAFFSAAGILKESKDYPGAEIMLRKAAELAPSDLDIRRQLGAVIALNLVHNSQEVSFQP